MKNRIIKIKGCKTANEVLLQISMLDIETKTLAVELTAWHNLKGQLYFQHEVIKMPNFKMCQRFIADYSKKSAREFVKDAIFKNK